MKKRLGSILVLAALLMALAAPGYAEKISIGFSGPLSGGAAKYGNNNLEGMKHAVSEINKAGGVSVAGKTYTFELTVLDDQYKPAETVSNVRRMMTTVDPKPVVVFCPHSGGILATEKFNEKEGFLLHGYTDNVDVLKQGNKLLIKAPISMGFYNSGIIDLGLKRGYKKGALLCGAHEAGKMGEKVFEALWKEKGGEIVYKASIDYRTATDFYSYLTQALAAKPDCIFLYGPSEPSAMVVSQARELGFKGGFLLGAQCKLDEMAKISPLPALSGSVGVCPAGLIPLPLMQEYAKAHKAMFGADAIPTSESAYNYEVLHIIAEAMKKTGTVTDAQKIRAAIPDVLKAQKHPLRRLQKITEEGQFISPQFLIEVVDGKFTEAITVDPGPWYEKYGVAWSPQ